MSTDTPARARFHAMIDGTAEDWQAIAVHAEAYQRDLPNRILDHLRLLRGGEDGYAVDRLEHSLQTATRALRAGESEEYVVCALVHDIGDTLGPANHADIAAAIVQPYVSEAHHWMVAQHGIFQGYYFFHHCGLDRNLRERFRGHPHFELTARFCHLYDQVSFDPAFRSMQLEEFAPMVGRVFSQPKRSIYLK